MDQHEQINPLVDSVRDGKDAHQIQVGRQRKHAVLFGVDDYGKAQSEERQAIQEENILHVQLSEHVLCRPFAWRDLPRCSIGRCLIYLHARMAFMVLRRSFAWCAEDRKQASNCEGGR